MKLKNETIQANHLGRTGTILYQSADKDYYKSIKIKSAFNGNYIKYQSNGDTDETLSAKKYLNMIIPYLSDKINYHKAFKNLKFYLCNEVSDYETPLNSVNNVN